MAGTSFVTPDKLGKLQYGSPLMNIIGDKLLPNALGTAGYDDDGVKARRFEIIKNGVFVGYQTTRELARFVNQNESMDCVAWFEILQQPVAEVMEAGERQSFSM